MSRARRNGALPEEDVRAIVASRVRQRREVLNLNRDDLAQSAGLAAATMREIEAARVGLSLGSAMRLARSLGLTIGELVGSERPAKAHNRRRA